MSIDDLKKAAAQKAVEQVRSGMVLGLGTGSTTRYVVLKIGELWQAGRLTGLVCIPTSEETAQEARRQNLPLADFNEQPIVDLAIDGADEVDPGLNLIKGRGGALLREKMVETAAGRFIVIVDGSKLVQKLGTRGPLPVEVVQFGWKAQHRWLAALGCRPVLRGGEAKPFVTDNGNYILDCVFANGIDDPVTLAAVLSGRPGIVEHGLFLGLASQVIVAESEGIRLLPGGDKL
jgi:ribose 5-phosphate isomerase A